MTYAIRKATVSDAESIRRLVNFYASEGKMLPRSLSEIFENIRDFHVAEAGKKLVGCCALHVFWEDLAEIRSLAVHPDEVGRGLGTTLVSRALEEAPSLGIRRVFILTAIPKYFSRLGFKDTDRSSLPKKIWAECVKCPKFPDCDEVAMIIDL